jgi:hypothetical protein
MSVHNYTDLRDEIVLLGETLLICKVPKVKYQGKDIKILNLNNRMLNLEITDKDTTSIKKIPLHNEEYKYLIECSTHLNNYFT